jgi:predicted ATPase/DNA-binding SARP family transcriptional activator
VTRSAYRFGVLGPLLVERDGEPVTLSSGHQRALLALLLAEGQPVPRDRLIDELWGERAPASAVKALHVHLGRLRGHIGDVIVRRPAGYELATGDYELDARRFTALLNDARAEGARGRPLLTEALGLFRGAPLSDVESDGVVAGWRRSLERERLEAIIARVDLDLSEGQGPELVAELDSLLDNHPFEERIWAQLMIALNHSGRQADALETFQRVRRLFVMELGCEPGEPLSRLQAQLLAGEQVTPERAVVSRQPTPKAEVRPAKLGVPRPPSALVGRASELAEVSAMLVDPDVRVLTLVGPGGVGKTRLALELAHVHGRNFADGALFVGLDKVDDPGLIATELAAALSRREGGQPPPADRLSNVLAEREMLLVLDNFEHLLAGAPAVAELVSDAPLIRVVTTSRAPLRIRGEQLFEVEPLPVPANDDPAEAGGSPSVQLFLQLALAADRRLVVNDELLNQAARICRDLEGIPLAIELAAAQLRVLTTAQIVASLERPLALGEHSPRDLPGRQRTLAETIRWSYDLLPEGARELLLAAGVFRGGFTPEAIEAVAGRPVRSDLYELVDASLARRDGDDSRFRLLELVRSFALSESAAHALDEELRGGHRAYFAELAAPIGVVLDDGDPPGPLAAQLLPEHANLRAAVDDAIEHGDRDHALTLVRGMRSLWYVGWLRAEGHGLIERILQRFEIDPEDELILLRAGSFLDGVGADSVTHAAFTHRLAHRAQELGDMPALAIAVANLASLALNAEDRAAVAALKPQLEGLAEADIPARHLAFVNYTLALALYLEGDIVGASARNEEAVRLAASVDHAYALGTALELRVMLSAIRDQQIRRSELAEALATTRRAAVMPLAVVALWLVARYAAEVDRDTAIRLMLEAERIYENLDARIWPESDIRAETLFALGIETLPSSTELPHTDYAAALAFAAAWLADREPGEIVSCTRPEQSPLVRH